MRVAGGWTGAEAAAPDFRLLLVALRAAQAATPTARAGTGLQPRRAAGAAAGQWFAGRPDMVRTGRFSAIPER